MQLNDKDKIVFSGSGNLRIKTASGDIVTTQTESASITADGSAGFTVVPDQPSSVSFSLSATADDEITATAEFTDPDVFGALDMWVSVLPANQEPDEFDIKEWGTYSLAEAGSAIASHTQQVDPAQEYRAHLLVVATDDAAIRYQFASDDTIIIAPPEPPEPPEPKPYYLHTTPETAAMVLRHEHGQNYGAPGLEMCPVVYKSASSEPPTPARTDEPQYCPAGWSVDMPDPVDGEQIWQAIGYPQTPNSTFLQWKRVGEGFPANDDSKENKWGMNLTADEGFRPWPSSGPLFHFSGKSSELGAQWEDIPGGSYDGCITFPDCAVGVYRLLDHYLIANPFSFYARPERIEFPDGLPAWLRYDHLTGCLYKDSRAPLLANMPGMEEIYTLRVRAWHGQQYAETVIKIRILGPSLLFGDGGDIDPINGDPVNSMRRYCDAVNKLYKETPVFILPGEYNVSEWGSSQWLGGTAGDRYVVGYDRNAGDEKDWNRPVLLEIHRNSGQIIPTKMPSNGRFKHGRVNFYSGLHFGGVGMSGVYWRSQTVVDSICERKRTSNDVFQTGGHNDGLPSESTGPSSAIRYRTVARFGGQGNVKHIAYDRGMGSHITIWDKCDVHSPYGSICLKIHSERAIVRDTKIRAHVAEPNYEAFLNAPCADQILNLGASGNNLLLRVEMEVSFVRLAGKAKWRGPTTFIQKDSRPPKWCGTRPTFGSPQWNKETFAAIADRGLENPYNDGLYVTVVDGCIARYRVIEDIGVGSDAPVSEGRNEKVSFANLVTTYPRGVDKMFGRERVHGDPCNGGPNPIEAGIIQDWTYTEMEKFMLPDVDRSDCWWVPQTLDVITENNTLEATAGVDIDDVFRDDDLATEEELAQRAPVHKKVRFLGYETSESRISDKSDTGHWWAWPRSRMVSMSESDLQEYLSRGW